MKEMKMCYLLIKTDEYNNTRLIGVYESMDTANYYAERQMDLVISRSKKDIYYSPDRSTENVMILVQQNKDHEEVKYIFRIIKKQLIK